MKNTLHYDYRLQVWLEHNKILACNHPPMCQCNAYKYQGLAPDSVKTVTYAHINHGGTR